MHSGASESRKYFNATLSDPCQNPHIVCMCEKWTSYSKMSFEYLRLRHSRTNRASMYLSRILRLPFWIFFLLEYVICILLVGGLKVWKKKESGTFVVPYMHLVSSRQKWCCSTYKTEKVGFEKEILCIRLN